MTIRTFPDTLLSTDDLGQYTYTECPEIFAAALADYRDASNKPDFEPDYIEWLLVEGTVNVYESIFGQATFEWDEKDSCYKETF